MNKAGSSFGKFLFLWSGQFISAIGSGLTSFGLGIYVLQMTGQTSAMALVTLLAFMPSLLLSPVAGVLADRYDRRLLMVLGDSLSATGLIYILICMLNGGAQLWQICIGVTVSSVFSSLLDPAYKATITDMLTEEQYTKASGFVQIAGSAKYLISPLIAGLLLAVADVELLLIIDICTFFVTMPATLVVRSGLVSKKSEQPQAFIQEFKEGWKAVSGRRGVLILVIMTSVMTFFIGFIETLAMPMILAFSNSTVLGTLETVMASGMLVSSAIIGALSIRRNFVRMLAVSLFCSGLSIAAFGLRENVILIGLSGFLFLRCCLSEYCPGLSCPHQHRQFRSGKSLVSDRAALPVWIRCSIYAGRGAGRLCIYSSAGAGRGAGGQCRTNYRHRQRPRNGPAHHYCRTAAECRFNHYFALEINS